MNRLLLIALFVPAALAHAQTPILGNGISANTSAASGHKCSSASGSTVASARCSGPPPTLTVDVLFSMNTASAGTVPTATIGNAGTVVGSSCIIGDTGGYGCSWRAPENGFTLAASQPGCANLGPVAVNGGATFAPGSLTHNSIAFNDANSVATWDWTTNFDIRPTNITFAGCITFGPPDSYPVNPLFDRVGLVSDGGYLVLQQQAGTCGGATDNYCLILEGGPNDIHSRSGVTITPGGTYWISLNYDMDAGTGDLFVYTTLGAQIGHITVNGLKTGFEFNYFFIGNNELGTAETSTVFQNFMLDWTNHSDPLFWQ